MLVTRWGDFKKMAFQHKLTCRSWKLTFPAVFVVVFLYNLPTSCEMRLFLESSQKTYNFSLSLSRIRFCLQRIKFLLKQLPAEVLHNKLKLRFCGA